MNHYPHHIGDFNGLDSVKTHNLPMVYVLASSDMALVKIGLTTSARQRFINIQSACPFHVSLWAAIKTPLPAKVEKWLHREFSEFRTRGEWFAMPDSALDRLGALIRNTNNHIREVRNGSRP